MRKGKEPDPDPSLWLMDPDPDPGGPKKTCGSADPDPDPQLYSKPCPPFCCFDSLASRFFGLCSATWTSNFLVFSLILPRCPFFLFASLLDLGLNFLFLASIFRFWPHNTFCSLRSATLASFFSPLSPRVADPHSFIRIRIQGFDDQRLKKI